MNTEGGVNKTKAQDILSPDYRRSKTELTINAQRINYSDDGLSGYTVSSLGAVHHRFFLYLWCVRFFRLQSGLSISWALHCGHLQHQHLRPNQNNSKKKTRKFNNNDEYDFSLKKKEKL